MTNTAAPDAGDKDQTLTPWSASDYTKLVDDVSGAKLADSGVAPLVAAARGYRYVELADSKNIGVMLRIKSRNSKQHRHLDSILEEGGGAMLMPRFRPGVAAQYRVGSGSDPLVTVAEFRPILPILVVDDKDATRTKQLKYTGLFGAPTVIDLNPATPAEWLEHTPVVVITEGVLKADSGLTAMLRSAGIPDADLTSVPETWGAAVDALRQAMEQVPQDRRVMFLATSGVASWHQNPEWNDIRMTGRAAWLAFDGDVETNRNVWNQATQMWRFLASKKASPLWLKLPTIDRGDGTKKQSGLDDYLAHAGDWGSLPALLEQQLPKTVRSVTQNWRIGDVRVNEELMVVEKYTKGHDSQGNPITRWEPAEQIIGRVLSMVGKRTADDIEVDSGTLSDAAADSTEVSIEVSWVDQDTGEHQIETVTGPEMLLDSYPRDWRGSKVGAHVPPDLSLHPDWPASAEWLSAIKRNRSSEIERSEQWGHMGWVPTSTPGEPVFIVGKQVVGREGFNTRANPGVDAAELDGATMFGVAAPANDDAVRNGIRAVLDSYGHAWTDKRFASVALAAAMRPVVPLPCRVPLTLIGSPRSGKSWTAGAIMAFWQPRPGTWSAHRLPGSAADTAASTEIAISKTPIWVIDDLAPSVDEHSEKAEAKKLDAVIRAVFNRSGRRRAGVDMKSREVKMPRAFLMVTGENNRFTASVQSRYMLLEFPKGSLETAHMEQVNDMTSGTTIQSELTFAAIKMLASGSFIQDWETGEPMSQTWADVMEQVEQAHWQGVYATSLFIDSNNKRAHETAGDFMLGLWVWEQLCRVYGMPEEADRFDEMRKDIISLVSEHVEVQNERTPGQALLQAIRATLSAGQAHISSVDTPGSAPVVGEPKSSLISRRLGWMADGDGGLRPGGANIGYLVREDDPDPVVLLDSQNAFSIAAKNNRDLVLYGSTPSQAWNSTWEEKLTCPDGEPWKRPTIRGRKKRHIVRVMASKQILIGVPFRLSTILGTDLYNDEDLSADDEIIAGMEAQLADIDDPYRGGEA